jgi:hypothetical protein
MYISSQIFLHMAVSGRSVTCVPAASSSSASVGVGIYRLKYYFTWLFQVSYLCARHILVLGVCRGGPLVTSDARFLSASRI